MSMNLTDQTVLVTGGARGLGRALTDAFLREGATVIVNYHSSGDTAASLMAENPGRLRRHAGGRLRRHRRRNPVA
ncbi:SDR family NAD(P)-dependent oxidoreductase [Corynebacterium variabile]|uniref:SDR family NAD(P)-dependent oxidoreductase n=1 Tax=Corynebacterium variabile TaxID=1727 RepID=UPI003CB59BAE